MLPLLTTKRVYTRAILHELLWFISGTTSTSPLSAAGVKIWDGNGSRTYLDSVGLTSNPEGDLGPVYGFQWRHFGAEYRGPKGVSHVGGIEGSGVEGPGYEGEGVDQLASVVRKLKEKPYDRRILMSAWNVKDLGKMALPPCHLLVQFYVSFPGAGRGVEGLVAAKKKKEEREGGEGEMYGNGVGGEGQEKRQRGRLSCHLTQRSADMGLGVPFNIASYALLTHMLAFAADLEPGELIHSLGDAHVYLDHVEALKTQLEREPREFPEVWIKREEMGTGKRGDGVIDGWRNDEFEIRGYKPWPGIGMKMSV